MQMSDLTHLDAEHLYFGACYGSAVTLVANPAAPHRDEIPSNRSPRPEPYSRGEHNDLR